VLLTAILKLSYVTSATCTQGATEVRSSKSRKLAYTFARQVRLSQQGGYARFAGPTSAARAETVMPKPFLADRLVRGRLRHIAGVPHLSGKR
jgi:hypothetical protein